MTMVSVKGKNKHANIFFISRWLGLNLYLIFVEYKNSLKNRLGLVVQGFFAVQSSV